MLASTFIWSGIDSLRNPAPKAPIAERAGVTNPQVQEKLGIQNAEQAVRINGAVQVGAGLLLAAGKFPRLASFALAATLVPTTYAGHPFWAESDPESKRAQQTHFLKNVSMLGGLLISGVDTEGRESLARKTKRVSRRARRRAEAAAAAQRSSAERLRDALPI